AFLDITRAYPQECLFAFAMRKRHGCADTAVARTSAFEVRGFSRQKCKCRRPGRRGSALPRGTHDALEPGFHPDVARSPRGGRSAKPPVAAAGGLRSAGGGRPLRSPPTCPKVIPEDCPDYPRRDEPHRRAGILFSGAQPRRTLAGERAMGDGGCDVRAAR